MSPIASQIVNRLSALLAAGLERYAKNRVASGQLGFGFKSDDRITGQKTFGWKEELHPRAADGKFATEENKGTKTEEPENTKKLPITDFLKKTMDERGLIVDLEGNQRGGDWFNEQLANYSEDEQREGVAWLRENGTPAAQRWQLGAFNRDLRMSVPQASEQAQEEDRPADKTDREKLIEKAEKWSTPGDDYDREIRRKLDRLTSVIDRGFDETSIGYHERELRQAVDAKEAQEAQATSEPEVDDEEADSEPPFDPMQAVKVSADSIDRLRKQDVQRVIEWTPEEHRGAVADFISKERPDLADEVSEVADELKGGEEPQRFSRSQLAEAIRMVLAGSPEEYAKHKSAPGQLGFGFVSKGGQHSIKWDESKHPRAEDGKFGHGSGNSSNTAEPAPEPGKDSQSDKMRVEPQASPADDLSPEDDYKANGTRAKAFKNWFGDWENDPANSSKVVDPETGEPQETGPIDGKGSKVLKDGVPVNVYHGTANGYFEEFDKSKLADPETLLYGPGFYFTEDQSIAKEYTQKDRPKVDWALTDPNGDTEENRNAVADTFQKAVDDMRKRRKSAFGEKGYEDNEKAGMWKDQEQLEGIAQKLRAGGDLMELVRPLLKPDDWGKSELDKWQIKSLGGIFHKKNFAEVKQVYLNIRKPFDADEGGMEFDDLPKDMLTELVERRAESQKLFRSKQVETGEEAARARIKASQAKEKFMSHAAPGVSWEDYQGAYKQGGNATARKLMDHMSENEEQYDAWIEYGKQSQLVEINQSSSDYYAQLVRDQNRKTVSYDELVNLTRSKAKANKMLADNGFDGITHTGGGRMGDKAHRVWIAFEPNQIKATDNKGTFDPSDNRMKYRNEGERWITIGGGPKGEDGKRNPHGFPVKIDGDGRIVASRVGGLQGKLVSNIKDHFAEMRSTADSHDHARRAARAHGAKPSEVRKLMPQAHQFIKDQVALRETARTHARNLSKLNSGVIAKIENAHRDWSTVDGFDGVARDVALAHPELGFDPDDTDTPGKVWELIREGKEAIPAKDSREVAELAAQWAKHSGTTKAKEVHPEDSLEFSRKGEVDRTYSPLAAEMYAKQLGFKFDEEKHPRDKAGKFMTAGQAASAGKSYGEWDGAISDAFRKGEIDDDHPAWKSIQVETAPTVDEYNEAKRRLGTHVRSMHGGEMGKVTAIADDAKSVTVTHADGKTSTHRPDMLHDLGADVTRRLQSAGHLPIDKHAAYLGQALAKEAIENGENIGVTMKRHGISPTATAIRAAIAENVEKMKASPAKYAKQLGMKFDESKHPRDGGGKFSEAGHELVTVPEARGVPAFQAEVRNRPDGRSAIHRTEGEGKDRALTTMHTSQVKTFLGDLAGRVTSDTRTNDASVNKVLDQKATFISRGNDGLAFDTGDGNVVKAGSDLAYHWSNGIREPGEGAKRTKEAAELNNKLRAEGVPGLLEQTVIEHDGRTFLKMPKLTIPEKLTRQQLDQVQKTVTELNKRGYAIGDELQPGLDSQGNAHIYDTGSLSKSGQYGIDDDMGHLKRLFEKNGEEFDNPDVGLAYESQFMEVFNTLKRSPRHGTNHWQRMIDRLEEKWKPLDADSKSFLAEEHHKTLAQLDARKAEAQARKDEAEPAPAPAPEKKPEKKLTAVAGMQQGLFGGGERAGGQKSLFNVVHPTSKPKPTGSSEPKLTGRMAEFLAKKDTVSPADLAVPLAPPSLPGQKKLFSRGQSGDFDEAEHPRNESGQFIEKDGDDSGRVKMRQAKAGGEVSEVDGKFYKGGLWLPVHGLYSGQEKPEKKPKREADSGPVFASESSKGPVMARQLSPEQVEAERARQREREEWAAIQSGPLGQLLHLGDSPHNIRHTHGDIRKWAEMFESGGITTDSLEDATDFARDQVKQIEENKSAMTPEDWEYYSGWVNENAARDRSDYAPRQIKKLLNAHPAITDARSWVATLIEANQDIDTLKEINDRLARV